MAEDARLIEGRLFSLNDRTVLVPEKSIGESVERLKREGYLRLDVEDEEIGEAHLGKVTLALPLNSPVEGDLEDLDGGGRVVVDGDRAEWPPEGDRREWDGELLLEFVPVGGKPQKLLGGWRHPLWSEEAFGFILLKPDLTSHD